MTNTNIYTISKQLLEMSFPNHTHDSRDKYSCIVVNHLASYTHSCYSCIVVTSC